MDGAVGRALRWRRFWVYLYWIGTPMPLHRILATSAGVWFTFMLGTALMSLAFLSSGTGHDEQIEDFLKKEAGYDDQ